MENHPRDSHSPRSGVVVVGASVVLVVGGMVVVVFFLVVVVELEDVVPVVTVVNVVAV